MAQEMGTRGATQTIVKITAGSRVCVLGIILWVALILCSRHFGDRGGPYFMAFLAAACVVYLLAMREFFASPIFSRRVVLTGLILAALWHVAFLRLPSGTDDDIHRYVWDGRLQRLGYNPYLVVPSDPSVKQLHSRETRSLNNPDLPSPYPPGALLFFRAVTAIHESVFAMKAAFAVCEIGIVFALLNLLRSTRQPAHMVLAFAWNPLLAIEVAGSGHIDIVGALLLVISAAAFARRWRLTAALTFALAVSVKFLPIVLLPLYWKRLRIRDAVLAVVVVGLLCVPFLNHGRVGTGSLGTYVQTFRFNGPVFAVLDRVLPPRLLVGLAVLAGLATAAWLRKIRTVLSSDAFAWPMAASLLFAPVVFPWYLLWLLPFLTSASTLPVVVWTVSIIPTYLMWHWRALGHSWGALPAWIMVVEYGCVFLTAMFIWFIRGRQVGEVGALSE
jgi:alpha-1,6-mannosyltransferase